MTSYDSHRAELHAQARHDRSDPYYGKYAGDTVSHGKGSQAYRADAQSHLSSCPSLSEQNRSCVTSWASNSTIVLAAATGASPRRQETTTGPRFMQQAPPQSYPYPHPQAQPQPQGQAGAGRESLTSKLKGLFHKRHQDPPVPSASPNTSLCLSISAPDMTSGRLLQAPGEAAYFPSWASSDVAILPASNDTPHEASASRRGSGHPASHRFGRVFSPSG